MADTQQREDLELIAPHFDEAHYRAQNPDLAAAGGDPLFHFLVSGWRQGLDPGPGFDTRFYLAKYPDVAASDVNPLVHYLRWGAGAGRLPRRSSRGPNMPDWIPQLPGRAQLEEARQLMARHFDPAFYADQNPDLGPAHGDPLLHYLVWGWRQGLHPCRPETFDAVFYRETYPDMEECDLNPLLHYLRWGAWAGRLPRRRPPGQERVPFSPDTPGWVPALPTAEQLDEARRLVGEWFDEAHYLSQEPDLAPAAGDTLLHFLVWGWRRGLDPSLDFDVSFYLGTYPEVAETEVNPLLHFLRSGIHRNMVPRRPAALWKAQLDFAQPVRAPSEPAEPADGGEPLDRVALVRVLADGADAVGLAVVLSHEDIIRSVGGVRNVVGDELEAFRNAGWRHLHVVPHRRMVALAAATRPEAARVELGLDGVPLGMARVSDLIEALAALRAAGLHQQIIVHHFAGHAPEHVRALVAAAGTAPPVVWVHDFFTLCPSYALMRNDIAFCGAPPIDSAACTICCYGEERRDHLRRLQAFFAQTLPTVLAPSDGALALWRRNGLDHARAAVVPLVRLRLSDPAPRPVGRPIRVAHLGPPIYLKGWAAFDALVARYAGTGRYAFYQLGRADGLPIPRAIQRVPVQVDADDRDAMARAVADHAIDVVLLWSLCRETFSFTAHEALAGGAFVVTRREAGNIWPAVQGVAPEQGCALDDEAALMALFEGDRLGEWVARPRASGVMVPGDGTCGWLARGRMAA